ncbi:MAG: CarD family transcriptional regulator [Oscillospiraceae bacterium]|nr:CarD family transcriptional regulator [Oscillospiraceae bacterium]
MREIGEIVLYGTDGVCQISEITEKKFGKETTKYYVLSTLYRGNSVIYVPVGNEKLESKMRDIISREELDNIICNMPKEESIWIENEPLRKIKYKEIITGGDRRDLFRLIKTLYEHRINQENSGKKMHMTDERFMKDAEKILYDEIAHVIGIDHRDVVGYITEKIGMM